MFSSLRYRRRALSSVFVTGLLAAIVMPTGQPGCRLLADDEEAASELRPGDVDPETSRVYVWIGKRRLGHEHGVEGRVKEGRLKLNAREDAGEIVFDMKSFSADTAEARKYVGLEGTTDQDEQADVTKTMLGKSVLNVDDHPTATFAIGRAPLLVEKTDDGDSQYLLEGEFTLCGETQALKVVAAAVEEKDGQVRLRGNFTIKQSDFGIKPYRAFGGIVAVTDEIRIYGDLWIVAE